jgi:peptidase S41-like protein
MGKAAGLVACLLAMSVAMLGSAGDTANAQEQSQSQPISTQGLQADAAILRRAFEELHPGLYRYHAKAQMDGAFATLATALNHDLSPPQAYVAFSTFAATIESGVTYANFSHQPDAVATALFHAENRVPFFFEWIDGDMVVTRDFTHDHALPRGSRIAILNDVPTRDILARLLTVTPGDGANDAARIAQLGVRGTVRYEPFDIFWPLLYAAPTPAAATSPRVVFFPPHGETWHGMNVQALTFAQRSAAVQPPARTFAWRTLPDGAAYLRMPTWELEDAGFDWKTWLNARLDDLVRHNPPALVIDVRGNDGGVDAGDPILARLVTHDVAAPATKALVRYRAVPADLAPYLSASDSAFTNLGASAIELHAPWPTAPAVPYYALERAAVAGSSVIHARAPHYGGRVFVLVDASVRDATFRFAQFVQQNKLGTLIGQPTGGNQRGTDGGAFFFLRLPNSKIEIDLPLIGTFPLNPQPNAGLTPNIVVAPTADDIATGRDPVLDELARALAAQAK